MMLKRLSFFVNGVKVESISAAPYNYNLADLDAGVYNIYAIATDATGLYKKTNTITITVETPILAVQKTDVPPVIDGVADDIWANAGKLYANNVLVGAGGNGSDNCSGSVQLLWDDNKIYALCTVTDDQLVHNGGDVYEDDNVELYFDSNNSKGSSYDSDDVQFSFNYDSKTIATIPSGYNTKGIDFVVLPTNTGYNVEASIPWSNIKCNDLKSDMLIGFEFMINDDDNGGSRDNKISWNATSDNAWQSAFSFGTIKIVGEVDPSKRTAIEEELKQLASLYPNPASDFVIVDGIDGEFNYEILDIAGKIQAAGTASRRISVAALPKGIYLVRIKDGILTRNLRFVKE